MLKIIFEKFQKDPLQGFILASVVTIHFVFLVMILFCAPGRHQKKEHKPLIVRTVAKQPLPKMATAVSTGKPRATSPQSAPAAKKMEPPKPVVKKQEVSKAATPSVKKPPPVVKKEPAIADKKLAPSKQAPPQKAAPVESRAKISDSLLKELEESIAKIENKSDKTINEKARNAKPALAPISLQIDTTDVEDTSSNYADILIGHLHGQLSLPDYGEVKIQLSLRQDGTVAKLVVLRAKNEKNRQYLEKNLPCLLFPRFEGALANKKEHTFVLTFCNEN